jgi:hypothetical protein
MVHMGVSLHINIYKKKLLNKHTYWLQCKMTIPWSPGWLIISIPDVLRHLTSRESENIRINDSHETKDFFFLGQGFLPEWTRITGYR